jgi:hypothetical protein
MCSVDSKSCSTNYNIVLECFWLEVKRESILIRNCKIFRISFVSLGCVKFKTLLSSVLIKTVITKKSNVKTLRFFSSFSETSGPTEQKPVSSAQPSLPCLPQAFAPLFRLSDPHGRHRLRRRGRLPGQEVVVETSDEALQSFLHLVSDLSARRARITPHRLVCRTSG